jgi:hypothetical protein
MTLHVLCPIFSAITRYGEYRSLYWHINCMGLVHEIPKLLLLNYTYHYFFHNEEKVYFVIQLLAMSRFGPSTLIPDAFSLQI